MGTILIWSGKKNVKYISTWGMEKQMLVQPHVAIAESAIPQMGILVTLFEIDQPEEIVTGRFWGLVTPQNVIASWRGAKMIERLERIEHSTLADAWYAGSRNPHSSDQERVDSIKQLIGESSHNWIMAEPIPEEIIESILKLARDEETFVAVYPLTEEVEAGTLEWRSEFAEIGAKHPEDISKRKEAEEITISRYEEYLSAYAKQHNHPRECMIMWAIEASIVDAVEKGLEQYGQDIVLGAAIARGHGGSAAFASSMFGPPPDGFIENQVNEAITSVSNWLTKQFRRGFLRLRPIHSHSTYQRMIADCIDEWDTMPKVNPLTMPADRT